MSSNILLSSPRFNPPWLWNSMTDMFSSWFSHANTRCGKFELASMECMEYYGFKRGKVICKDYYEDFIECRYRRLEVRGWDVWMSTG